MHPHASLKRFFSHLSIDMGRMLAERGKVSITYRDEDEVEAEVEDGDGDYYEVLLRRNGVEMTAGCECDQKYCRHAWAALLAAESEGLLLDRLKNNVSRVIPLSNARVEPWRAVIQQAANPQAPFEGNARPLRNIEVYYEISPAPQAARSALGVSIRCRERRATGHWGTIKQIFLTRPEVDSLVDADRQLIDRLAGVRRAYSYNLEDVQTDFLLTGSNAIALLEAICATGKAYIAGSSLSSPVFLSWDSGPPWIFALTIERAGDHWVLSGRLRRGTESMALLEARFLSEIGVLCAGNTLAQFEDRGAFSWIATLRKEGTIHIPVKQGEELVAEMLKSPSCPPVDWPAELRFDETRLKPRLQAMFVQPGGRWDTSNPPMLIEPSFDYAGQLADVTSKEGGFYFPKERRFLRRDYAAEREALATIEAIGAKRLASHGRPRWEIAGKRVPGALRDLVRAGWEVSLEGQAFRNATGFNAQIKSGIDWFEVHGSVVYDGGEVPFPKLLAALERGEQHIALEDGSLGIVPDEFLARYGSLLRLGKKDGDHVRFARSQASLLDVMLLERGEASADQLFLRVREGLRNFDGIKPAPQPKHFKGELRHYQLEGLGWLEGLRGLGLGGCLADEMGVGKTPQVLALLETRRGCGRASLVVVPRSLIYNWIQEAARFTPKLKVLDHSVPWRAGGTDSFEKHDVVLTTYGMLRRDIVDFREYEFDYAILDEAQAIKNSSSESAKAAKLLRAEHRLVMTGTPIENHLGELWSLFEFLNPGMLGASSVFHKGVASLRNPSPETRQLLSRALQPFILRRTKAQVIKELPQKIEQTIFCEMDTEQKKLYDEMRQHYRQSLLGRVSRMGMAKSKMHILEALLRLRQAACHPGLLDKQRSGDSSAKFESLLPQLEEVLEGGHKAIVFSQFTSLLAILQNRLDSSKVVYSYLDGKTKDRQAAVERFQNDADCKLFLVSLKAGGLGLNLTAAEYVFLLDPWWNPAVESQAIDRAHRIGQKRTVFAYRLISRGTVEEKVLELQKSKRELADAILGEDNRLMGNLKREDLELLLS